jgi:hypothetical protein
VDGNDNLGSRTEIRGNSHLSLETRTLISEIGAGDEVFEAYIQHQFKIVPSNINILADHKIWSTIKTLPATLPKASSENYRSSFKVQETVSEQLMYWNRHLICYGVGKLSPGTTSEAKVAKFATYSFLILLMPQMAGQPKE